MLDRVLAHTVGSIKTSTMSRPARCMLQLNTTTRNGSPHERTAHRIAALGACVVPSVSIPILVCFWSRRLPPRHLPALAVLPGGPCKRQEQGNARHMTRTRAVRDQEAAAHSPPQLESSLPRRYPTSAASSPRTFSHSRYGTTTSAYPNCRRCRCFSSVAPVSDPHARK